MTPRIDFNCDLGEGQGNDATIIPLISSANIACGAHAGDESSMRATLRLCRQYGIAAGAHPGYADREHFGRRERNLTTTEVTELVLNQLTRLATIAVDEGVALVHVKPHGALYNQAARDPVLAESIALAVASFDRRLILVGLADSALPRAGRDAGLRVAHEAFSDRRYLSNGSLAPRSTPGAVIDNIEEAVAQALSIVLRKQVRTLDGESLSVHADTLCLHGDRADAADFAQRLRAALDSADVQLRPL